MVSHGRPAPSSPYPFLDHDGPIAFAHRGGAAGGLENSLTAFGQAVAMGYRYLETDVHATSDGVLLAFHDRTLDRVTDRRGRIARLPYAQVRRARIGGTEPIPLLEDVLQAWPQVRVNVDVKEVGAIGPLVEVIRRTGALDRVCVASFSERRLAATRRALGPRLCTALGPAAVARLWAASGRRLAASYLLAYPHWAAEVPCVQVPEQVGRLTLVTAKLVDLAHGHGQRVHVWTVDDAAQMHRLLDLGVDGIMTDEIATLRHVLLARGMWPT